MAYGLEYIIKRKPFIDGTILNNLSRLGENMGMELVKCFCQMFRGLKAELGMSMRMFSQRSTQGKFDVHNNYTVFSYSQQHNPPVRIFRSNTPRTKSRFPVITSKEGYLMLNPRREGEQKMRPPTPKELYLRD